jgi:hypothetical protein
MSRENPWFRVPAPDLRGQERPGKSVKVHYPVGISYNGGTVIKGEWFAGYKVDPPIVPEGYQLVDICVGLELNCAPPMCTKILKELT